MISVLSSPVVPSPVANPNEPSFQPAKKATRKRKLENSIKLTNHGGDGGGNDEHLAVKDSLTKWEKLVSKSLSQDHQKEKWATLSSALTVLDEHLKSMQSSSSPYLSSTLNLMLSCHLGFFSFLNKRGSDFAPKISNLVSFVDRVLVDFPEHESLALAWGIAFKAASESREQGEKTLKLSMKMLRKVLVAPNLEFQKMALKAYFTTMNNLFDYDCAKITNQIFSKDGIRAWETFFEPSPVDESILHFFLRHTIPNSVANVIPRDRYNELPQSFLDHLPLAFVDLDKYLDKLTITFESGLTEDGEEEKGLADYIELVKAQAEQRKKDQNL